MYVGVAEFVEDAAAAAMVRAVGGASVRDAELPRLHAGGPLALVFVPRWARAALLLEPMCPEV